MNTPEHPIKEAAGPSPICHLRMASSTLTNFLESGHDRVFVLKGPYGAGKSFFLRDFLGSARGQAAAPQLKFLSYASVFGVNDLKELQSVIIGSIGLRKLGNSNMLNAGVFDKALKLFQKGISPFLGGINLELSAGSLIWSIAKHQGLLLVIDDIDRKGSNLPLESIVGFANSLAEHSEGSAKIIFVLNDEKLETESSSWSKLREKFIDCEFRFHPSPEELAEKFVEDESIKYAVGRIHSRLDRPNIRTMRKIQSLVRRYSEHLKEQEIAINHTETEHVARCAALYLHSGIPFHESELMEIYTKNWYIRESDPPTEDEKELYRLMELIEFSPDSDLDLLVFGFFRNGVTDKAHVQTFAQNRMNNMAREQYESDQRELWKCYNANFLDTEKLFIDKSIDLLEKYRDTINLRDLNSILTILHALDIDVEEDWKFWLNGRLPRLRTDDIQAVRQATPKSLHSIIDAREKALRDNIDPTSVFREIYEGDGFGTQDAIAKLSQWTEQDYLDWFSKCDDPNLFSQLRDFLRFDHGPGHLLTIKQTLTSALTTRAQCSTFDRIRIAQFFGSLIQTKNQKRVSDAENGDSE
jgi:hypothetical protein